MRQRSVQPEVLETLEPDSAVAIRSREDLQVVNAFMGNPRWIRRMLKTHAAPDWTVAELGAGDGRLSLDLLEAGICQADRLCGLDLAPRPVGWPPEARWHQGDIFSEPLPPAQVLVANLFLHHFEPDSLAKLGARIPPETRLILAAEPARFRIHSYLGRVLCWLANLNWVTRYDMQVSIRAGFRGRELPASLELGPEWQISIFQTVLGGYRMLALR